jgi:predicted NAD-dependent protein-ADP-ribosyltransferase YbiA (DUF1768 family)
MAISAPDASTGNQLLRLIRDGGQPSYLLFWDRQPRLAGSARKRLAGQWRPAASTVGGVSYPFALRFMMAARGRLSCDARAVENILAVAYPGAAGAPGWQVRGFGEQRRAERRFDAAVAWHTPTFGRHRRLRTGFPGQHRQPGPRRGFPAKPGLGHRAGPRR